MAYRAGATGLMLALLSCLWACTAEPRAAGAPVASPVADAPAMAQRAPHAHARCVATGQGGALPDEVRETSGLAESRRTPGIFWTHNDSGHAAEIHALDPRGALAGTVRVAGADLVDWEDIEAARCASGDCLYIADTGDNDGRRDRITVYEIPEPGVADARTVQARAFHARYPDGRWDSEALFVIDGRIHLVTKGRRGPIAIYRYPAGAHPGGVVELERVRELLPRPRSSDDRVTAATTSPDGRWVAIRTYRTLYLYEAQAVGGRERAEPAAIVDIRGLDHPQGESVVITADGMLWLTSEARNRRSQAAWSALRCDVLDV